MALSLRALPPKGETVRGTVVLRRTLRTPDGRSLAQVVDDHAREMRRANDLQGTIAAQRPAS